MPKQIACMDTICILGQKKMDYLTIWSIWHCSLRSYLHLIIKCIYKALCQGHLDTYCVLEDMHNLVFFNLAMPD